MLNIFKNLLSGFWALFKYPFFIFWAVVGVFVILILFNMAYFHFKGYRLKKGSHVSIKKRSFWKKIFIDAPRQYVLDMYERDPDFFRYQGVIIYEGRQGNGKTIAMTHDIMQMQKEYPLCKVITNLGYAKEDDELKHWKQLIEYKNGIYGVIAAIDETQNWWSSNQSKNFPPKMLEVITQNRKNRRVIAGTAQNFYLLAKAIRSQCTEVRECITLFGCITIVRRKEPFLDSEGNVTKWKYRGIYFFVHDEELRNSYDTYKVIESLSESGFQEQLPIEIAKA